MLPLDIPTNGRVTTEPRIGGVVRNLEEEEELLLALTILRINQRLKSDEVTRARRLH